MNHKPFINPKDPLIAATSKNGREATTRISRAVDGFPADAVVDGCLNMVINVLRQQKKTWPEAEKAMQEIHGRTMNVLKQHYDSTGRRKGVFAHDQVINAVFPVKLN